MKKTSNTNRLNSKNTLYISALLVVIVIIIFNIDLFKQSLIVISDSVGAYVLIAALLVISTYVFSTASFYSLKHHKVLFNRILLVQIASGFANRLLPAGVGGLALNTRFFVKQKHKLSQALSIVTVNNFMGFLAHISLLLFLTFTSDFSFNLLPELNVGTLISVLLLMCFILILFRVLALYFKNAYKKIEKLINSLMLAFKFYSRNPFKLTISFIASVCLTISYFGCLYFCVKAIGVDNTVLQAAVVFSAGVIFGSISPTPGGVGGAEIALTASLVATGSNLTDALSVALLFRFLTFWLPIIPGFIAFQYSLKRSYI